MLLWPLAYALRYLGFTVLQPQLCHDVHGYHKGANSHRLEIELTDALARHRQNILDFDTLPEIPFNRDQDFDEQSTLKAEAPSHSYFIRHSL
jgi:NAD(P)H dehydrogenase (quinone)